MPILTSISKVHDFELQPSSGAESVQRRPRTFPVCANSHCSSGWLQVWRSRRVPVLEGGWLCSPACTRARIEELLHREYAEARPPMPHRHRVPIGLVLLQQGWIEHQHLKEALEAQRKDSTLRVGEWLVAHCGLSEAQLTHALGLQLGIPVFSLAKHGGELPVTLIPRLLQESFGFVSLRVSPAGRLFIAFEDHIDHCVALAVQRMTGLHIEPGLLSGSEFADARRHLAEGRFPHARLIEAGSMDLLAEALTRHVEKEKPAEARLVRVHDLVWLRMWRLTKEIDRGKAQGTGIEDVMGSVVSFS